MALTRNSAKYVRWDENPVVQINCSTLDAGLEVDVAHGGPSGATPYNVTCTVITPPTDGSDVKFSWIQADNDTTNNEIRVQFDTEAGGDLTGAVVLLHVYFNQAASGGLSTFS